MACVEKFTMSAVVNQLRHIERTIATPSNPDIDPTRSYKNYSLIEPREISSYDYFLKRKQELYCYNRDDVKVMAGWVVTAPADLASEQEHLFFEKTSQFLQERYGRENTIQSIVHYDESGRPHLHHYFIPASYDAKHNRYKICAAEVLTPLELRNFHPALDRFLKGAGINCSVITGITREIGGSISVEDLKKAEKILEHKHQRGFTW